MDQERLEKRLNALTNIKVEFVSKQWRAGCNESCKSGSGEGIMNTCYAARAKYSPSYQADPISGKCIIVKESENYKNNNIGANFKKFALNIIDYFNLEQKLRDNIVPNQLKYGDSFIEVIDLESALLKFV